MPFTPFDSVRHFVAAAGVLGTAAFGLVEAAKGTTPLGRAGLGRLRRDLGQEALEALKAAYGAGAWSAALEGAYRGGSEALASHLRNGLRLGLDGPFGRHLAESLGLDKETAARALAAYVRASTVKVPEPELEAARRDLGRLELALDARIQGAMASAQARRAGLLQVAAGAVAVAASLGVALLLGAEGVRDLGRALLLGAAAVPLAPISKDLVSLLQTARDALARRGA